MYMLYSTLHIYTYKLYNILFYLYKCLIFNRRLYKAVMLLFIYYNFFFFQCHVTLTWSAFSACSTVPVFSSASRILVCHNEFGWSLLPSVFYCTFPTDTCFPRSAWCAKVSSPALSSCTFPNVLCTFPKISSACTDLT